MESIWTKTAPEKPVFDSLKGDIKTDVLIIGGGMAGILCAYMLKNAGVDCIVAEADEICGGITKNTTAKITLQHGLIYDKIIRKYGTEYAKLYFDAQSSAIAQFREICKNIDCDFTERDNYIYSLDDRGKIERETEAINRIGGNAIFCEKTELPFSVAGAVKVSGQAQFHPLKFAFAVAKDLPIFENTKVLELKPNGAVTNRGMIKAEKIIVATHFPFLNKHGSYFIKMYQHRSYVTALDNASDINGMYLDEDEKGLSFRSCNGLLLLGGGSHRTGKKGGSFAELADFAKRNYPSSNEVCRWATQDCMTLDGIPYIGLYSNRTPSLYVATGFNKWGMSSAMASAMILCDLVRGRDNEYALVFSPSRSMFHPQLFVNAAETFVNLITPTVPRCPHLGCALKYNPQEHSWDCPCHGSRFTKSGELIDNPATDDLMRG